MNEIDSLEMFLFGVKFVLAVMAFSGVYAFGEWLIQRLNKKS